MKVQNSILLYNPISNEGHLDSWHVLFIEVFLAAGWDVIPVTTDPQGLRLKLERKGLWGHSSLHWLTDVQQGAQTVQDRVFNFSRRVLRQLGRLFESAGQRERRLLAARFLEPQQFKDHVDRALGSYPGRVKLIFNMFVDGYLPNSPAWNKLAFHQSVGQSAGEPIPWVGLGITPERELERQQQLDELPVYYSLLQYCGSCFLDEAAVQSYRRAAPTKQFTFLPDITETELLPEANALVIEIKRRAAGRRIVFMGGSIGKQKNLAMWIALILSVDPTQWYFVQIGRISHNSLNAEDTQAFARLQTLPPKNLYVHADYLPDEATFNAIIAESSVIFAVYRDFYRSSNMLSKAAYFEKPILVADQCLMGERVIQYEIGLAVQPDSLERIQAGLLGVTQLKGLPQKFARYRSDFNRVEFSRRLTEFASACVSQSGSMA